MDQFMAGMIRHIFQHHIDIHETWEKEQREEFARLFNLDSEELEAFDYLHDFICNHGLERLIKETNHE